MNLLNLDAAQIVALVVSVVIPLCSSLLARAHWPAELVGVLTLVISAGNGFAAQWAAAGSGFDWRPALGLAVGSFIVAVLSRYGLWRGTATDAKLLAFPASKPAAPAPTPVLPPAAAA